MNKEDSVMALSPNKKQKTKSLNVGVRELKRTDLSQLLCIEALNSQKILPDGSIWDQKDFLRIFRKMDHAGLVAYKKNLKINKILGFLLYNFSLPKIKIITVVVHPDFEGQGVGTALVSSMKSNLKNGFTDLEICVREKNMKAQYWLKKQQFRAVKVVFNYFDDEDAFKFRYINNGIE